MTQSNNTNPVLKFIPVGGMGEVTRNMFAYEFLPVGLRLRGSDSRSRQGDSEIVVVDCGIGFPEEEALGVEFAIPDFTYLRARKDKIKAIFFTHAHEDHIGAVPFFVEEFPHVPLYATKLTAGLIRAKLKESRLDRKVKLNVIDPSVKIKVGDGFEVEFFRQTHSVPDAVGISLNTPVGRVLHTGDFKVDFTPIDGRAPELGKVAHWGQDGVLALVSDCLRVERKGYTASERVLGETFHNLMEGYAGRIILTMFSSDISRLQQAIDVSYHMGRKVVLVGRSMERNAQVALELGFLKIPKNGIVSQDDAKKIPDHQLTLIAAGAQGQPGSSLARIAEGSHSGFSIRENDLVIFSSDPIPGNESQVSRLIDKIVTQGADVLYSQIVDDLHISGHGHREELKLMIALARAKFLIPVGGTFAHMKHYSQLAQEMGYGVENIFALRTSETVEMGRKFAKKGARIKVEEVFVGRDRAEEVEDIVLRDRKALSREGIIVPVITLDKKGKVWGDTYIVSRGFVYMKGSEKMIRDMKKEIKQIVDSEKNKDIDNLKNAVERRLAKKIIKETHLSPIILPVFIRQDG